ncbi:MAG TPA: adventurous gliding motility lipoprotein CglB [Myxococcaceae bacterium]|jgi:hypothetical protein
MTRLFALTAVLAAATSCQSYDLEPVNPLGLRTVHVTTAITHLKARPDLMLMVDKSGSMTLPINPADARCPAGCGPASPCPAGCPTRWTELQAAMDGFLTRYGGVARMGLTQFAGPPPGLPSNTCVPGNVLVDTSNSNDVPAELMSTASQINTVIAGIRPAQGTPTGPTLQVLSSYAALDNPERDDYVLLLTDGLPNCNPNNPNTYRMNDPAAIAACRCTATDPAVCDASGNQSCLDKDGTVSQLTTLSGKGVKTVVVGFGAETATGAGPEVLTAMGQAGGYTLTCPLGTDAECAGGTCNLADQTCSNTYYQAGDRAALSAALARLAETIDPKPCEHKLPLEPSDPKFISVVVDGRSVPEGDDTWHYVPPQTVNLVGSLCARAEATTSLDPMDLSIGVIQTL